MLKLREHRTRPTLCRPSEIIIEQFGRVSVDFPPIALLPHLRRRRRTTILYYIARFTLIIRTPKRFTDNKTQQRISRQTIAAPETRFNFHESVYNGVTTSPTHSDPSPLSPLDAMTQKTWVPGYSGSRSSAQRAPVEAAFVLAVARRCRSATRVRIKYVQYRSRANFRGEYNGHYLDRNLSFHADSAESNYCYFR